MTYTKDTLKDAIVQKLRLNYGCTEKQATDGEMMKACAMVLRDIMAEHGVQTREKAAHEGQRKVHYLSSDGLSLTAQAPYRPWPCSPGAIGYPKNYQTVKYVLL